ncbi:MAG: PKD domain-containing protein [bacterium]
MRLHPRLRLALLVPLTVIALLAMGARIGAAGADIVGDDEQDAFVGSGSLLLPSTMYSDGRKSASDCPGCRWRATVACRMNTAGSCRGPARLCGPDGQWLRIWVARPGGDWQDLGAACFGPDGPLTRAAAELMLVDTMRQLVPPLAPAFDPPTGILPHLPVVFRSGQPAGPLTSAHELLGMPVSLTIEGSWSWDFGDGHAMTTVLPGAPWPDTSVNHAYERAGTVVVGVRAEWRGEYVIDGLGPLEIEEPVYQEAAVGPVVGEGRAVLVS